MMYMRQLQRWPGTSATARQGLTLIELVVVLVVLVALAGMLIPFVTGFVQRSHGAQSVANLGEVTKALTRFEAENFGKHPDLLDGLVDSAEATDVYFGLTDAWADEGFTAYQVRPLSAEEAAALRRLGIRNLRLMPSGGHATFYDANLMPLLPVEAGTNVCIFEGPFISNAFSGGADPLGVYVVLGIGGGCTAIGNVMTNAPLHFDDEDGPADFYARFLAVYKVGQIVNDQPVALNRARFTGVLCPEPAGLDFHFSEYYDSLSDRTVDTPPGS